jgi:hypothetical protein
MLDLAVPPMLLARADEVIERSAASGAYGVDFPYRAAIALCCLGENLPQDAV